MKMIKKFGECKSTFPCFPVYLFPVPSGHVSSKVGNQLTDAIKINFSSIFFIIRPILQTCLTKASELHDCVHMGKEHPTNYSTNKALWIAI